MGSVELASGVVGVLLPALVAVVVRANWPSWVKGLVSLASSVAAGLVVAWLAGELDGKTWAQAALIVFGAAQTSYRVWWQPTGIAPAIEDATSPADEEDAHTPEHAAPEVYNLREDS